VKQIIISDSAKVVLKRSHGAMVAIRPVLEKFAGSCSTLEEVHVEVWHDDNLYIEVKQASRTYPYNMRALVTFKASLKRVIKPGEENNQYHFARKGWVAFLTDLLGEPPTVYSDEDGTRPSVPKPKAEEPTIERIIAEWESEGKIAKHLWLSAATEIVSVLKNHTPENALELLKKATPHEMAVSAYYERAINDIKELLRWQKKNAAVVTDVPASAT